MGDMVQDSVLVFSLLVEPKMEDFYSSRLKLDLFATPEDLIDTWGPG